jgi:hypothetical protein
MHTQVRIYHSFITFSGRALAVNYFQASLPASARALESASFSDQSAQPYSRHLPTSLVQCSWAQVGALDVLHPFLWVETY